MPTRQDLDAAATTALETFLRGMQFKREGRVEHVRYRKESGVLCVTYRCLASAPRSSQQKMQKAVQRTAFVAGPVIGIATLGLGMGGITASMTPDGVGGNNTLGFGPQHVVAAEGLFHRKKLDPEIATAKRKERLRREERLVWCLAQFRFGTIPIPANTFIDPSGDGSTYLPAGQGMPYMIEIRVGLWRIRHPISGVSQDPKVGPAADLPSVNFGGYFALRNGQNPPPITRTPQQMTICVLTQGQPDMTRVPSAVIPVDEGWFR